MKPMPNLMETELETFGASTVEDFTWKQLFDTDACTVCGRCTSVCPAHATGKPLDPREIVLKVGEVMAATGDPVVSPPVGVDRGHHHHRRLGVRAHHVGGALGVHVVQGVRRDLPGQHRDPRQDPRHAPLPLPHGERLPRRARQHVPVDGELVERVRHEPGRAGRLGRRARGRRRSSRPAPGRSTTSTSTGSAARARSTTATRRRAAPSPSCCSAPGIDFAILGPSELCTGDPARRSGNEYIFQMLAMQNIESLDGLGVQKIITQCPHCFNTLKNEYPQLGGNYEVVHHSQLLSAARRRRPPLARRRDARRARHLPRQLLPRPSQRRVPRAAQRDRLARRDRRRRDAAQRHQGHVLRRRRRAHVDGGAHRQEGEHRAHRRGARHRRRRASPSPARSAT